MQTTQKVVLYLYLEERRVIQENTSLSSRKTRRPTAGIYLTLQLETNYRHYPNSSHSHTQSYSHILFLFKDEVYRSACSTINALGVVSVSNICRACVLVYALLCIFFFGGETESFLDNTIGEILKQLKPCALLLEID